MFESSSLLASSDRTPQLVAYYQQLSLKLKEQLVKDKYLSSEHFAPCAQILLTTRCHGDSVAPYDSFNVAHHVGDNLTQVMANRQTMLRDLGCQHLCFMDQTHSNRVCIIKTSSASSLESCQNQQPAYNGSNQSSSLSANAASYQESDKVTYQPSPQPCTQISNSLSYPLSASLSNSISNHGNNLISNLNSNLASNQLSNQESTLELACTDLSMSHASSDVIDDVIEINQPIVSGLMCDGIVTAEPHVALAVMTADCLPLLLCDPIAKVVGAIHCGWKGIERGIIAEAIAKMSSLGAQPSQIKAFMGAAIGAQSFEVGGEVKDAFAQKNASYAQAFIQEQDYIDGRLVNVEGKFLGDLYGLCRMVLQDVGVLESNIAGGEFDTRLQSDVFYSYRQSKITGRLASVVCLM